MTDTRVGQIASHWWVFVLRGIAGILFGIFVMLSPGAGLMLLVLLFGGYAIVDGVMGIILGMRFNKWLMAVGGLGVLAGIAAFMRPMLAGLVLLVVFAAWVMVMGAAGIYEAFTGPERAGMKWLFAVIGAMGVVMGILLLANPGWGLLTFVMVNGFYSLVSGIAFLVLGFQLRGSSRPTRLSPA